MSERPIDGALPRGTADFASVVTVHFDGACQPPRGGGVATYGYTVDGDRFHEEAHGLAVAPWSAHATNNVAEYVAAIRALEWLRSERYSGPVLLLGDSQLVIRQMRGEYEVRAEHLRQYHEHLRRLANEFADVQFVWVAREENTRADALSKEALEAHRHEARRHRPDRRIADGAPSVEVADPEGEGTPDD